LQSKPVAQALQTWLTQQRPLLVKADATAKAIDYTLGNWTALTQFLNDGAVPIDNNAAENAIRPLAVGRKNGLFAGSQLAGERAAVLMSLIESAKLSGHDPWAYLKDIFERLPTLKNRDLAQLLPHNWRPVSDAVKPGTAATATAAAYHHKHAVSSGERVGSRNAYIRHSSLQVWSAARQHPRDGC
jgi:transposase